jgi:hypothetical protein
MGARYEVVGAAVVVPTKGGSERYVYRGGVLGADATAAGIKHLLELGLVEEVDEVDVAAAAALEAELQAEAAKAIFDEAVAEAVKVEVAKAIAERDTAQKAAATPAAAPQTGQPKPAGK